MTKQPAKPRNPPVRKRPVQIRVMVTEAEQKKLLQAARKADLPLVNLRSQAGAGCGRWPTSKSMSALKKAKRDEA